MIEVLIIGSGFAAATVYRELRKSSINVMILDSSSINQDVEYESTPSSIFSNNQLQKTAKIGGGIDVWGSAVTFPTTLNFFNNLQLLDWQRVRKSLPPYPIEKLFSKTQPFKIQRALKEISKFQKYFPQIHQSYAIESHAYVGKSPRVASTLKEPKLTPEEIFSGVVKDIYRNFDGSYSVEIQMENGDSTKLQARTIIFASGAIINSLFVQMVSGNQCFDISNHVSAVIGNIIFRKPIRLGQFVQAYNPRDSMFFTLANDPPYSADTYRINSALRFVWNPSDLVTRGEHLPLEESNEPISTFTKLSSRIRWITQKILARFGLFEAVSIRLMVDLPRSELNWLRISPLDDGKYIVSIKLELLEANYSEIALLLNPLRETLSNSKLVKRFELVKDDQFSEQIWGDSAHYSGTVPIGPVALRPSVDSNLELNGHKGIFVLGNSSFSQGSHGHPTLLSVLLAKRLAAFLIHENSSQRQ